MRNIKLYESVADQLFYPSGIYPSRIAPRRESRGGANIRICHIFTPLIYMPNSGGTRGAPPKSANANGCGSDNLKFPDQSIKLWSNFFGEVHHGGQ